MTTATDVAVEDRNFGLSLIDLGNMPIADLIRADDTVLTAALRRINADDITPTYSAFSSAIAT